MDYKEEARRIRIQILEMIHGAQTSHVASNFSAVDIAVVLYNNLKEGDEVVWSAGWKAALIYSMLAKQGNIPIEDLDKFPNPPYLGLAETSVNGVWVSGGSMGHGLPIAVGMALGKKKLLKEGTIYCIMSDGELNEGTTWESAMLASHHKLDNLVVLVDKNGWQAMGKTNEILNIDRWVYIWSGFKWNYQEIDGHDYKLLETTLLKTFMYKNKRPNIIVCNTIKGKGVSFFENSLLFHYKHITIEEYEKALAELCSEEKM